MIVPRLFVDQLPEFGAAEARYMSLFHPILSMNTFSVPYLGIEDYVARILI